MPPKRRHPPRHTTALAIAVCAAMGAASLAWSQSETASDLNELIDQLAAPAFADREEATDQLVTFEGQLQPLILSRMGENNLVPEQLVRLETILKVRFLDAPRAALGVAFTPPVQANRLNQIPVMLDRVLPGFPCSATLKAGDIIRVVDGFELPAAGGGNRVRSAILSHLPGEELELLIERDGRRSFVRVPLGDYARLNNAGPGGPITPQDSMLKAAWQLRKTRLALASPDAYPPLPCVPDVARSQLPNLPERKEPEIQAGGSPDNGAALLHLLRSRAASLSRNKISATSNRRVIVAQPGQRIAVRVPPEKLTPAIKRTQLKTQLAQAIRERERYLRIVARDDIAQEKQQIAITALTEIEARIALIKSDIAAIDKPKAAPKPQD